LWADFKGEVQLADARYRSPLIITDFASAT
jgi:hypothetical protein